MDKSIEIKCGKQLQDMKAQITEQLHGSDQYGLETNFNDSIGELSGYDNHPADIGSEVFERSKDLSLREASYDRLEKIDMALKKIDEGTYGKCERCDKMIPKDRLEAMPESIYCLECEQEVEKYDSNRSRPVEEDMLYSGYLSEESWNDVEQYGTSNDISMMDGETDYNSTYMNRGDDVVHYHMEYDQIYIDEEGHEILDSYQGDGDDDETTRDEIEQYAYLNYLRQQSLE